MFHLFAESSLNSTLLQMVSDCRRMLLSYQFGWRIKNDIHSKEARKKSKSREGREAVATTRRFASGARVRCSYGGSAIINDAATFLTCSFQMASPGALRSVTTGVDRLNGGRGGRSLSWLWRRGWPWRDLHTHQRSGPDPQKRPAEDRKY